jgi:hypothetical protein
MCRAVRRLRAVPLPYLVSALILALGPPLAGCDRLFGIPEVKLPPGPDPGTTSQGLDNTYTCECTCNYKGGSQSLIPLSVCATQGDNPNIGGTAPSPQRLAEDCTNRVQAQVQAMTNQCYRAEKPDCTCVVAQPFPDTFFDTACDNFCNPVELADCSQWDPRNGVKDANCAAGTCLDPGAVCLKAGTDPAEPEPSPLTAGLMGRVTQCRLDDGTSELTVGAGDQSDDSPLRGVVRFAPAPGSCSPGETCLTMDYRMDPTQTLHFDGFLFWGDTDITSVATVGASTPFALGVSGTVFLDPETTQTSGRGKENGDHRALFGTNGNRVVVGLDDHTCTIQGSIIGGLGDPDGDNTDFNVEVRAFGSIENTPPQASLGSDRTVECTAPSGADVVLDGTGSSDHQDNIVSFGWYRGSRDGDDLGTGPTLTVSQALGSDTYFLKTIDEYMQSDEASATITVEDSTGPTILCNAPATITPRITPYSFTATAEDVCDASLAAPQVDGYECFAYTSKGKRVPRRCQVATDGSTFTIIDSGGVGDYFRWWVRATDASDNTTVVTCETDIVRPGPGPPPP